MLLPRKVRSRYGTRSRRQVVRKTVCLVYGGGVRKPAGGAPVCDGNRETAILNVAEVRGEYAGGSGTSYARRRKREAE